MLDEQPLVTIITVTYNSAAYVRDAIESVLAQTYTNIQYIIADDCSKDSTWEIINEYNDSRIIAYRNEKNLGEYPNRNKAIRMATGKYLFFIDGDDVLYSHGAKHIVDNLEMFPHVAMAIQSLYHNNIILPVAISPYQAIVNYFYSLKAFISGSFSSTFFNTEILKKEGGLSENYRTGDEEIRLRLASKYDTAIINCSVSWARETPGSASSSLSEVTLAIELRNMTHELIRSDNSSIFKSDLTLKKMIQRRLDSSALRLLVLNFLRFNFKNFQQIVRNINKPYNEFISSALSYRSVQLPFSEFTPMNPYQIKRIKRCVGVK